MKFCPICNQELIITDDHYYGTCMNQDHFYQCFIITKHQIAVFNNCNIKEDICFGSADDIFKDYVYLQDFSILKSLSYKEAKIIYNRLKVFI